METTQTGRKRTLLRVGSLVPIAIAVFAVGVTSGAGTPIDNAHATATAAIVAATKEATAVINRANNDATPLAGTVLAQPSASPDSPTVATTKAATVTPRPTIQPPPPVPTPTTGPKPMPVPGGVQCGGSNDTIVLQAALDKGGVVTVNAGTCVITAALHYGSDATLQGAGQDVTTIKNAAGRNGDIMLLPVNGRVDHFTIKNLTLDANSTTTVDHKFTVSANATSYFLADHVTFRRSMQMGVWTDGVGATATDHLTIRNSKSIDSLGGGFSFFGQITDSSILDNEIVNCHDDAIAFQENVAAHGPNGYPKRITISGNYIHDITQLGLKGADGNGINVYGSDEVTIRDNRIVDVISQGLRLGDGLDRRATNLHAYNNTIDHAGYNHAANPRVPPWGISIERADKVDGGGNTIVNCDFDFRNVGSTNVVGFPWPSTG